MQNKEYDYRALWAKQKVVNKLLIQENENLRLINKNLEKRYFHVLGTNWLERMLNKLSLPKKQKNRKAKTGYVG